MSADLPDGAVTAAQEYDLAHRDDADQPRWQTWSRVDDHQVTRLLAGALPALTAAIAERAAADERERLWSLSVTQRFEIDDCLLKCAGCGAGLTENRLKHAPRCSETSLSVLLADTSDGAVPPGGAT